LVVGAATLAGLALVLSACSGSSSPSPVVTVTQTQSAPALASSSSAPSSTPPTTPSSSSAIRKGSGKPVHVSLKFSDGTQVGVGMPIIAFLSRPITNAHAFAAATKVTVNGTPVKGGWFFERNADPSTPVEADYRLQHYWPGHAQIHLDLPVKGLTAGRGLVFNDSLTLSMSTGPANLLVVDNSTHTLTVTSDGKVWGRFPVSLGALNTPTQRGIKVIMEQGDSICMSGPGYSICGVKWTQRLTYGGEYLHSAPWNVYNITHGINSSNGCTNLLPADAKKLFKFLEPGDVVSYPNANGPQMALGDGYGDWNVPWSQWLTGGLYVTV
jgi:lipoprotein-anchoring transpeptidase ErfK/SrfK